MAVARRLHVTAHGQAGLPAACNDRVNLLDHCVALTTGEEPSSSVSHIEESDTSVLGCPSRRFLAPFQTRPVRPHPSRNPPLEHMLVAVHVTMGAFLVWAARDPVRFLPLIDFVIVSGAIHATTMAVDAWYTPGMVVHLAFRGDVIGTYIAPVTLALTHPRRFYLFAREATT
jgi:hypothetical protein